MCRTSRICLTAQCLLVATLVLGLLLFASGSASAHQSPPGCTTNAVNTTLSRSPDVILSGDIVTYSGTIGNGGPLACDATITSDVVLHCPAADGTPTGVAITVLVAGAGIELPADGSNNQVFGPVNCTVSGDPDFYTAQVKADGVLHDSASDQSIALIEKSVTVQIVECFVADDCVDIPFDEQCQDLICNENNECEVTNKEASTACVDIDDNVCTVAGCDGLGACNQQHVLPDSTPCTDTGNECAIAGCDGAGNCDQLHILVQASTPCTDTGNECAIAGCDGAGNCDQLHAPVAASTPCTDTDDNVCTIAGCDGLGACNQRHMLPDSTPCLDTGNECAIAGCDGAGNCDQLHILVQASTPCTDTGNECANAGCNGLGACDQLHAPVAASTPCTDTDDNVCTIAGCDGLGACNQRHMLPDSTPCLDTGNECATAGCDGAGNCDQRHVLVPDSTPCEDTDGIECTTAGCDGAGSCDQRHIEECDEGCLTRTPGFWGTHPTVTQLFLPVDSCGGVDLNNVLPSTAGSAIEDLCFSNQGDATANNTSPQQLQLIRQCAAAALNFAASTAAKGTCENIEISNGENITEVFTECCIGEGDVPAVCNSGAAGPTMASCIDRLDEFNNSVSTLESGDEVDCAALAALDPTSVTFLTFCPGLGANGFHAEPETCDTATGNGFVNPGRALGPPNKNQ